MLTNIPEEQNAIRARCFHPSGAFIAFEKEDVEQSLPRRFEKIVEMYSERIAVKTKDGILTYEVLNRTANRIAWAILERRGKREEPIALLFEQGASAIIAILAVLKAGRIYVPLDPSFPSARLAYILEDSQASLIVTNNKNFSMAQQLAQNMRQLINIDELNTLSIENPRLSISPDTFACILYTSGSTGQPKGVVQNHRKVLYDVMQQTNVLHISAGDRLALLHSYGYSASLWEIFPALLNGAGVFPFNLKEEGPVNLVKWLAHEEITISGARSHILRHCVTALTAKEQFPNLRLIHAGGDNIYKRDVELYKKHFPSGSILVVRLGANETGTVRQYFIDKNTEIVGARVPVGYPVEGKEVMLLGDDGTQVSFNQIGEIAVKSRYLSPGYWRRPDLTRAKFLPDPNGGDERVYLTGDLGRMLPDGCLEYLGRKDFRVKIRGYTIEVAEVEAALRAMEIFKEAVVVAREGRADNKRLIAYVVVNDKPPPTTSTLRRSLAETLPAYMVPSGFVLLDALPLLPNGKIDRRALPAPSLSRPELDTPFVAPRTPIEKVLAAIWTEILGLAQLGIHDNFLDLGGNSLVATQIVSRATGKFGVEMSAPSLLAAPTVAEMAVVVVQHLVEKIGADNLADVELLTDEEARRFIAQSAKDEGRRDRHG
jgi:amino acid adenylation domain-containing protein